VKSQLRYHDNQQGPEHTWRVPHCYHKRVRNESTMKRFPIVGLGPILRFYTLSVQHRFDVFFTSWVCELMNFKTLTKNKSVRKSYYRTVFDMTISAN